VHKKEIADYFSKFGDIKEVLLIVRKNKNKSFAYVEYSNHESALRAIGKNHRIRKGLVVNSVLALPKNSKGLNNSVRIF